MSEVKNGIVQLDAFEAASYWWIKRIKNMANEINESPVLLTPMQYEFADIFDYKTLKNIGYRKLYLSLAEKLRERSLGHSRTVFRTHAKNTGHDEIIAWLSEIMGKEVPCLNIGEIGSKEVVIMLVREKAVEPAAFIGEPTLNSYKTRLPDRFKVNSVLCEKNKRETENEEGCEQ